MRRSLLVAVLLLSAAMASAATAAAEDRSGGSDLARTPLERATFAALPAVYEIRVVRRVQTIRTPAGTRRVDRDITERGSGFGVAPGLIATARHLIEPLPGTVFAQLGLGDPPTGSTPKIVLGPPIITLWTATTGRVASELGGPPPEIVGTVRRLSDEVTDVALVATGDRTAPTLRLDDAASDNTPVTLLGFGGDAPRAIPTVRFGELQGFRSSAVSDKQFVATSLDVQPGDSGAPAIAADGRAHGVIVRRRQPRVGDRPIPAVLARADAVRQLLRDEQTANEVTPAGTTFAQAMDAFWQRDYTRAATLLTDLEHPVAQFEKRRATRLAQAQYSLVGPSRSLRSVLAFGALAALIALVFGVLRLRLRPAQRGSQDRKLNQRSRGG